VDGTPIKGNTFLSTSDKDEVKVQVTMG